MCVPENFLHTSPVTRRSPYDHYGGAPKCSRERNIGNMYLNRVQNGLLIRGTRLRARPRYMHAGVRNHPTESIHTRRTPNDHPGHAQTWSGMCSNRTRTSTVRGARPMYGGPVSARARDPQSMPTFGGRHF